MYFGNYKYQEDIRQCKKCGNRRFGYNGKIGKKALKVALKCVRCGWGFVKLNARRY